jgi:uncharacterized protein YtpQ (UPF0354 family)
VKAFDGHTKKRAEGRMAGRLRLAPSGPHDASIIVPVIKGHVPPSDDIIVLPPDASLTSDPLVGELNIFYAFDLPGHFVYVSEHDCRTLQLDRHGLRKLSVLNLVKRRSKPEILRPSDAVVMLRLDGDLEASLLLHDSLWRQVANDMPGDTIVAVPSRDVLVVSGTKVTNGVETLRRAIRRAWERPSNTKLLLTRALLIRQANCWEVLEHL